MIKVKEEIIKIAGKENVAGDEKTLKAYSSDYSLQPAKNPMLVVKPKDRDEVVKIVKAANEHMIPLVPVSSKVHFHGETVPEQGGIVVDLTRMDKVLEVDARNRKVKIEPGVMWGKLQEALSNHEQMALRPLFPHPLKSALTSSLEREPMLIPKYEYAEPVLTMEVVLPTGDLFKTGTASAAKTEEAYPEGPGIDFFRFFQGAQGTLGIVTWLNVKTEYLPKHQKPFFVPFNKIEDVIEPIYRIQRRHIGNECFVLNRMDFALLLAEDFKKDFEKLKDVLPPFTLIVVIAGAPRRPLERIAYEEDALQGIAAELLFQPGKTVGGIAGLGDTMIELLRTPQSADNYWKSRYKGPTQDIFFITTLNRVKEFYDRVYEKASVHGYPTQDIGMYIQPLERGRACHLEFSFPCDLTSPKEVEKVKQLYRELSEALISSGGFFSRPYGEWTDMVYRRASVYTWTLKEIKKIFDPKNILNPGKLCF
ncbi:MAG TPA: FAD-binding oxidoreductase [Thermodesulfobacteriota bacterium]|nr:FAD-binding oxidoreductase [Thermodesulfobacteriota bacterium]